MPVNYALGNNYRIQDVTYENILSASSTVSGNGRFRVSGTKKSSEPEMTLKVPNIRLGRKGFTRACQIPEKKITTMNLRYKYFKFFKLRINLI